MLDFTRFRLVIEDLIKGDRIHIIEYETDVFVMVRVLLLDGEESDILCGAAIECSCIALMREVDFVVFSGL